MADTEVLTDVDGPASFLSFSHVSVPCRDLQEGIRFYRDVLGGVQRVEESDFAAFDLGGTLVGISTAGCTYMTPETEYPHYSFFVDAKNLVHMQRWLEKCGVPTSNLWTRNGVETLMFFRDPSGNVIELFCQEGYEGSQDLPRGPARGHGITLDIDALGYEEWRVPSRDG